MFQFFSSKNKVKILIATGKLSAIGDSIFIASKINLVIDYYKAKGMDVHFDILINDSRLFAKLLYKDYIDTGKVTVYKLKYSMSRKPKNALNRLIKISTNFLYNCFYSSILRVKNYNYYISLHAEMPRQFVRMFNFIFKSKPYFFKFDTFLDYLKINSYYGNLPSLNFVSSHNFDKKTIGLYVAASSFQKIWHPRYWADLIRYIKHKYKDEYTINIYGNGKIAIDIYSSIMFYLDELKLYPNIDFFNCINKNSIELDLQHCKGLELAISNDSGFLWVANCFKIKNIAILGFEDGKRYSDLFKNSNFIYINSQLPCAPCNKYAKIIDIEIKCPYRVEDGKISFYKCSTESRAPQVYQAIDDLLARPSII